jgi:GT2 family glycosyltransferase
VQALGGYTYDRWTARGWPIRDQNGHPVPSTAQVVDEHLDYVVGASMLISRAFLETVGLMEEDYFLYFEELDWALRAKGRFRLTYCPNSIVYHKEGGSLGSSSTPRNRSVTSEYYWTRNRIHFTMRFYPYALPLVTAVICAAMVSRVAAGLEANSWAIFRGLFNLGLLIGTTESKL